MVKRMLLLSSSLMIMCSCCINERNTESSYSNYNRISGCKMDSTINEFSLMTPMDLDSIFILHVDNYIVNDFQYGEGIYVSNVSENEFVFMKFNCGRASQELDAFILSDSIPSNFIRSRASRFVSTNGAYIGMNKMDFIKSYFNDNESNPRFNSIYVQYDSINSLYNKYYFCNDTLRVIEIGYDW